MTARQIISPVYEIKNDDIIVILSSDSIKYHIDEALAHFTNKKFVSFHEISSIFERPHGYGDVVFDNGVHMGHRGYKILATSIVPHIDKILNNHTTVFVENSDSEYISYLKNICEENKIDGIHICSIVMNCNLFTKGHRYLIEEACKQCDYLYIFVVEEDKSYFKFTDRFEMVKKGTQDLENVFIIRSGKMILSHATMPDYFIKDIESSV